MYLWLYRYRGIAMYVLLESKDYIIYREGINMHWTCKKCGQDHNYIHKVTFKNGTIHYEVRCDCNLISKDIYIPSKYGRLFKNKKEVLPKYKKKKPTQLSLEKLIA
jgi:hypothetical protein